MGTSGNTDLPVTICIVLPVFQFETRERIQTGRGFRPFFHPSILFFAVLPP
jgi:hypothetical protein